MPLDTLIYLSMIIPVLAMLGNMVFARHDNLRDLLTLVGAVMTFACVLGVLAQLGNGVHALPPLFEVFPGLTLAFAVEPLQAKKITATTSLM